MFNCFTFILFQFFFCLLLTFDILQKDQSLWKSVFPLPKISDKSENKLVSLIFERGNVYSTKLIHFCNYNLILFLIFRHKRTFGTNIFLHFVTVWVFNNDIISIISTDHWTRAASFWNDKWKHFIRCFFLVSVTVCLLWLHWNKMRYILPWYACTIPIQNVRPEM